MVTEMCLPFIRLNGDKMVTEMRLKSTFPAIIQSQFSHHSVTIQSPFSRLKGEISSCDKIQNSAEVFIVSMTTGHVNSGAHGKNIFPWSTIKTSYTKIRWKLSLYKAIEIVLTEA